MKILVTGASGFIGKYVVRELLECGYDVVALVRGKNPELVVGKLKYIYGCLGQLDELEKNKTLQNVDCCIHLAWEGIPDYSFEQCKKNLEYGLDIIKLCKYININHLLIAGSCWEYEEPIGQIREDWKINSKTAFGAAKNSLRMLSSAFCQENAIHFNWLRLFYVIGSGQRENSLIPYLIKEIGKDNRPRLNSAYTENDFIDVEDVARAFTAVIEKRPTEEILNVGNGKAVSVLTIAELISEKMSKSIKFDLKNQETKNSFYADTRKLCQCTGWKPHNDIGVTVNRMLKYY